MLLEDYLSELPDWPCICTQYQKWTKFRECYVEFSLDGGGLHTKLHRKRAIMYALILSNHLGSSSKERDALGTAGAFHDSKRQSDWLDTGHGKQAKD